MTKMASGENSQLKNSIKAGLLSGLVFPGVGSIAMKSHVRGVIYLLLSLLLFVWFVVVIVPILYAVVTQFKNALDTFSVSVFIHTMIAKITGDTQVIAISVGFLVVWLIAVIDAIYVGHKRDVQLKKD